MTDSVAIGEPTRREYAERDGGGTGRLVSISIGEVPEVELSRA